ncbi:MAG: HNH endonuclease [Bacteroidota bacterium]|nr:HNH endonuclease [Bacteroidota bacterium]
MLHQEGKLIKVKKGIYRDDLDLISNGVEICADHRIPKDKGETNELDNGQTLCTGHNLMKKNYSQTEAGKRFFIKMYKQAMNVDDLKIVRFCKDVFDVYDDHDIDKHIQRPD